MRRSYENRKEYINCILSDSIHDLGDALSIGISYFLEKKGRKGADKEHTYGYIRYSVLGGLITTVIHSTGSILVIDGCIWNNWCSS